MRTTVPIAFIAVIALLSLLLWRSSPPHPVAGATERAPRDPTLAAAASIPRDAHFDPAMRSVRRLTDNPDHRPKWDNAEAYFSADGRKLVFQSTRDSAGCDVIYSMNIDGSALRRISNGKGRTTCPFFSPDGHWIVYASTHMNGDACPPAPDMSQGYTWAVYDSYEIFRVRAGGGVPQRLTNSKGYDAECVFRPDGKRVLFTSDRDGDLDLYDMDPDGRNVRRLTNLPGYDGGAFFTADGQHIVFRGRHPTGDELEDYRRLLAQHLVRPSKLDLYMIDADGGNLRALTQEGDKGVTSWAPFPHPDGRRLIFASNRDDFNGTVPGRYGYNFELYLLELGTGASRRLTFDSGFDGFPMFSADGKRLVWCGNYVPERPRDTDLLMCDWVDLPAR